MGNERAIQQNVTPSVLDRDLEERLLASRLVTEIRNNPEQVYITLSGEGVMEFAQAYQQQDSSTTLTMKYPSLS